MYLNCFKFYYGKMNISSNAYPMIGAISAAFIAGGISFLMAVLSKDQKTSEFRQIWIDGLRNEIADLVSLFYVMTDLFREMVREGPTQARLNEFLNQNVEYFCKLEMAEAKIKLRLNPDEHQKLLRLIKSLHDYVRSDQLHQANDANELADNLVRESQLVLKMEWRRVKRGETVFVATKVVSLLILVTAFIVGVAYAIGIS